MFAELVRFLRPSLVIVQAHQIYIALVRQAREPFFYAELNVPDTIDGRFDMILLHLHCFTARMQGEAQHARLTQEVVDTMMRDMDTAIRELGVGDTGVAKRLKAMAYALNGRLTAYENMWGDKSALRETLRRNVYNEACDDAALDALLRYALQSHDNLSRQPLDAIITGQFNWADLQALPAAGKNAL